MNDFGYPTKASVYRAGNNDAWKLLCAASNSKPKYHTMKSGVDNLRPNNKHLCDESRRYNRDI